MDGFLWRHSWEHIRVPAWSGGCADCHDHCTCCSARQDFAVRFAYKQQAEMKKPFGGRCQSSDMQQVLGRCCQALLTASEVQRLRSVPFIQGTEHTWLMSILPSSGSLLGLFVVFLGLTLRVSSKRCQILPAPEKSSLKQIDLHHTACPGAPGRQIRQQSKERTQRGCTLD